MVVIQGCVGSKKASELFHRADDGEWSRVTGASWDVRVRTDQSHRVTRLKDGFVIQDRAWRSSNSDLGEPNGAWILIREAQPGVLSVTTDRLASIPLYVGVANGTTAFASRLRDLGRAGWREPDPLGIYQWVLLDQCLGMQTPLRGVSALPGSTRTELDNVKVRIKETYWTPEVNPKLDGSVQDYIEPAITHLSAALAHCAPDPAQKLALPVTGGMDSRCNLALMEEQVQRSLLFHTEDLGDFELPIARSIAAHYSKELTVYSSRDWMKNVTSLDLGLETGEFNAAHWRLADTAQRLVNDHGAEATVDGFFQDLLFKASFVSPEPAATLLQKQLNLAHYRANVLGLDVHTPLFREFEDSLRAEIGLTDDGLTASQAYYIRNRSRRLVYNIVRLNQNHLDVRTPGLDHELIDFGLSIPWNLRNNALLYRHIIQALDPKLAQFVYDKSGLPLMDLRRSSWKRRVRRATMPYLRRILPALARKPSGGTNFTRLYRESPQFRATVRTYVEQSNWITSLLGDSLFENLELRRRQGRGATDVIGILVTASALNQQTVAN